MADNFLRGPGDKEIQKFSITAGNTPDAPPSSADSSLVRSKGGGLGKAAQDTVAARQQADSLKNPEPPPELLEIPTLDPPPTEDKPKEEPAVLSDPKWIEPDTLFQQEAEVSVQVALPKEKKDITRIQVQVFVKTPTGPESICKGEGNAQADGTAVVTLPIYKPKNHDGGPAEYYFEVTHKLAKMLSTIGFVRTITETALKSIDHVLIPGIAFQKDSSFITPKAADDLKQVEGKLKEWEKQDPKKTKIAVFGHTALNEKDAKGLSERRAQSAFAFITNDAGAWEKIYSAEEWGLELLQTILKDLGHARVTDDGKDGPNTQAAFKAIQKQSGLPETGQGDAATRKALFAAYMKGKHDIRIDASRFRKVADNPWMGCGANNYAKGSDGTGPENRRVTFALLKESKYFPVYFPCQDGNERACQGQCKKAGKRSDTGVKCLFYDELVREKQQEAAKEEKTASHDEVPWMPIAQKEIGVTEIPGEKHNPRILEYHQTTYQNPRDDDKTGMWCASFVNWCLTQSGFKGQNSARAQEWSEYGREVKEPIYGAIALVKFKKGGHHVGFVAGNKGKNVLLLGGNQHRGTKVSLSQFSKDEIQTYRLPADYKGTELKAQEKDESYGQDDYAGTR